MLDFMVNEPMPWQLTVAELRDALSHEQPNAVVGLRFVEDGLTVYRNLQIVPDRTASAPTFLFQIAEP